MAERFATQDQLDTVESYEAQIVAYQQKFLDVVTFIAGYIEACCPNSGIEIRLITGEGRDDESWRGHLLALSPTNTKVDLWTLTITMSQMLTDQENPVGGFVKPWGLGVDYNYDWEFGTDESYSEKVFNDRCDAVEFILEQIRTNAQEDCLPHGCCIESGMFRRLIKRFTNASTHQMKGDLALRFEEM